MYMPVSDTHLKLNHAITVTDFNLADSTQTTKPPILIPHQIFWLYGIWKLAGYVYHLVSTIMALITTN